MHLAVSDTLVAYYCVAAADAVPYLKQSSPGKQQKLKLDGVT